MALKTREINVHCLLKTVANNAETVLRGFFGSSNNTQKSFY